MLVSTLRWPAPDREREFAPRQGFDQLIAAQILENMIDWTPALSSCRRFEHRGHGHHHLSGSTLAIGKWR
jgi:hypothetical protein